MDFHKQWIMWTCQANGWLWDRFLILLSVGVCLFFTWRLKGIQLRYLGYCLRLAAERKDPHAQGEITPWQSMLLSTAGTLGLGSIIGVSTAIISGGFGAVLWMLLIAFFGLSVRYAEGLLAIKYRSLNGKKEITGGPMHYMAIGLRKKWLGVSFALLGVLGAWVGGASLQARGIALIARDALHLPEMGSGVLLCAVVGLAILGGIKRIASLTSFLASTFVLLYAAGALIVLISHLDTLPYAFYVLFTSAFSGQALFGGVLGASLTAVIHLGMTWGITAHQIGYGAASIASAVAKTDAPGRQALIGMGGSFLCIVLSAITALVLFVTDAPMLVQVRGGMFSAPSFIMHAFGSAIPFGDILAAVSLLFFGCTAIIGWGYFGEKCMEFLFKGRAIGAYRVLFFALVLSGSIASFEILWPLASCLYGLMCLTNMIALVALSSVVAIETRVFLDLVAKEKCQSKSAELNSYHNS